MRFPIILQHDASDCGPAALSTIASHYGKRISIARFRELAATDRNGTTLAGMITAAQSIGFDARAVRATRHTFEDLALPAVAHWHEDNRNHFVVVYRRSSHHVWISDPARGRRKLTTEDFHKYWSGIILLLTTTPRLHTAVTTPASFARLCSLLLPHRHLFLDVLLAAVLMTILGLSSSFFIQALVDFVFVYERTPILNWLGLGMLIVLVARSTFLALRTYLLAHLSQRIDADTVLGYHRHLLGLPLFFFSTRRTGEILSRVNDAIKIRVAVSATTLSVLVDGLLLFGTGAIMLIMNWRVTVPAILAAPVVLGTVWFLNRPMKRHQRAAMEKATDVEAQLAEVISGIHTLKAVRGEPFARIRTESRFTEMLESGFRAQMIATYTTTVASAVSGASTLGLLYYGAQAVLNGAMSVGELMALHSMLGMFLAPLERLSSVNQSIQDGLVAAERLGEILDLNPEIAQQRRNAIDRRIQGAVEFRNITFRYGSRPTVLENISLKIDAGECVGIMGESGSGKTTLVNLLGRFYEPSGGRIEVDGFDIRDYTFDCLRRDIGFVPQDIVLFSGSIADNIRMGRPTATPEELHIAARAARVDEIVSRLPLGFDTPVGERGLLLSGGERQRIALARAILQDPAILVLDEPTSHLDPESECAVQEVLDQRRGRRTTIVISHRALQFDRIIELRSALSTRPSVYSA